MGKLDEGAADFRTGGVAVGVEDARAGVRAFACAEKLAVIAIEACAPLDEFGNTLRTFLNEDFCGGAIDETVAGCDGVFKMECCVAFIFTGYGDAALCVEGVGLGHGFFGGDKDGAVVGKLNGGAQARDAGADDKKVHIHYLRHNL